MKTKSARIFQNKNPFFKKDCTNGIIKKDMKSFFPSLNQVILVIVIAEFVLVTAFGFLSPIFSVFVIENIKNATVAVVGFGITIYWITKSILQLFVARFIDKNHGEIDDYYFMIAGGLINSIVVSLYYFATSISHVFALQFLLGVGDAFLAPPFYAIFTRHIDKGKEGFEWSLYSSFSLGFGSALGGGLGGILATIVGFRAVFPLVGIFSFISIVMLTFLRPYILPKVTKDQIRIYIEKPKM